MRRLSAAILFVTGFFVCNVQIYPGLGSRLRKHGAAWQNSPAGSKGMWCMKIGKMRSFIFALTAAAVLVTASGCSIIEKFTGGGSSEESSFDAEAYESRIKELESQVESLRAETVMDIQFKDKNDYLLGKDNPAVSEAAALKEEAMADLPPTITIKGVEYSTKLTSLTLNNMSLNNEDIVDLKYMVNLTELHIYQNNITDITPLKGLTGLKILSLFNNKISDLSPLAGLISLEDLYLRANNITDISPLDGLYNLQSLDLSENSISDITPLLELRKLSLLRLNDNNVSDISALSGMKEMNRLHLQNNDISDITPLMNMASITEVYLENNNISDVEPLMHLTTLGWIKLGRNPISNLNPLTNISGLKKLYIEGIDISADELQSLQDKMPDTVIVTK